MPQRSESRPVSTSIDAYDMRMEPIRIDPEILGGTPCFTGTRVPVVSLFDYLRAGYTVDYFLSQFPTVSREQVERVLDEAKRIVPTAAYRTAG